VTTIAVARKGATIAIGSDSLVTFGDTRLTHSYEANEKVFKVAGSYVGVAGTAAHFPVLKRLLTTMPEVKLDSRDGVFDTFMRAHAQLKEQYFLNTKEDDDDPYESSQLTALIANASGIYGIYSYREVFSFDRFWAIGSGRHFALGAMVSVFRRARTAREVVLAGVAAGTEFDKNSAGPARVFTFRGRR
jgi:ATP-dependent HslUV protease, peptidase subunit HslV